MSAQIFAVEKDVSLRLREVVLQGSLLIPDGEDKMPVALIIAGSGPTDRNGNNPYMMNNSLRFLAEELKKQGIASLRYDKRGIVQNTQPEKDLRFEDYVSDAVGWIEYLHAQGTFSKVVVIGHK